MAMASAAKIFRLIDKVRSESDRDVGLTGCHRFVARGASAGARRACSGRFGTDPRARAPLEGFGLSTPG
jgi:hypothetical protein